MPQKHKARTFEVLIEQLEALAANKPVLMLLETPTILIPYPQNSSTSLWTALNRLPIMLVATYRPRRKGPLEWPPPRDPGDAEPLEPRTGSVDHHGDDRRKAAAVPVLDQNSLKD